MTNHINLKFRDDHTFTILQVTDVHNSGGDLLDELSLQLIESSLQDVQPDLVVFTGDQIRRGPHPREQFRQVTSISEKFGIPYAFVFGNHDSRGNITRTELMDMESRRPLCLAEAGPEYLSGVGNYVLTIAPARIDSADDSASPASPAAILYFFDCEGATDSEQAMGGRSEWIHRDKVGWYMEQSLKFRNKEQAPLPALAFFHIPLPEYEQVWELHTCYGYKNKPVRCPNLNVGMFAAMVEMGDVIGTFVGHDHSNDYWGELAGIRLCYGRVTGFNSSVTEGFQRGVRVIRLHEGQRRFDTWLRLEDGSIVEDQPIHEPEGRIL